MSEGINLTLLPPLDVVQQVDLEVIIDDIATRAALENASPSDPAYRVALAAAYREMMLRQDANEQAKGLMLAFAVGPQLDHLGVTYYKNPNGSPVIRLADESDADFQSRLQLSTEGLSVAGPEGAYKYHAKSAHADVKAVQVLSPAPVEIELYILSYMGNGVASQAVLDAVNATTQLNRPLTDLVTTVSADIIEYQITATLYVKSTPDPALVKSASEASAAKFGVSKHYFNAKVKESSVHAALTVQGVEYVDLTNWNDIECAANQAPFCTEINIILSII
jgi:phage-related baseplate assembly protein